MRRERRRSPLRLLQAGVTVGWSARGTAGGSSGERLGVGWVGGGWGGVGWVGGGRWGGGLGVGVGGGRRMRHRRSPWK